MIRLNLEPFPETLVPILSCWPESVRLIHKGVKFEMTSSTFRKIICISLVIKLKGSNNNIYGIQVVILLYSRKGIAQLVECWTADLKVPGSSIASNYCFGGHNSAVRWSRISYIKIHRDFLLSKRLPPDNSPQVRGMSNH